MHWSQNNALFQYWYHEIYDPLHAWDLYEWDVFEYWTWTLPIKLETKIPHCEHCNKPIHGEHITVQRSSGPSTHTLHFHNQCWKCPACGTNGPHYCPADIARE